MAKKTIARRQFLGAAGALGAGFFLSSCGDSGKAGTTATGPGPNAGKKPILIGITSDSTGQYANSGAEDRRGMLLAIHEFNEKGGVLGRKIETIHQDTQTAPAVGTSVARKMIDSDKVAFLIGGVQSGVANAISIVAQEAGVIYLNTNSSSPSEAGKSAHRTKFVWDGNGSNFTAATVKFHVKSVGKKWLLLTNDYGWGRDTSAATRVHCAANGAEIVDELLVPQNTRDFSSYLLKIQQLKPDVVAVAVGGDDLKVLRAQVSDLKLGDKPVWVINQQDWPDVYGLNVEKLFGTFGTTWYYRLPYPGVAELVARYQKLFPDADIKNPGNVFFNGYMSTRELLRAVERAGTTNNHKVIQQLENLRVKAADRLQEFDAYMNPKTHHLQQTIYLAQQNPSPKEKDDIFKIIGSVTPDEAEDKNAVNEAKLESLEETPVYEP